MPKPIVNRMVASRALCVVGLLMLGIVLLVGCRSSDVKEVVDDRPIPDGWSRVQFREGYVSRENTHGFTIDLPPGWSVGESWSGYYGPTGWITGKSEDGRNRKPAVRFYLGGKQVRSLDRLLPNDKIVVTQPLVEDQTAILYLAKEFAIDLGPQVGIFYKHIPGAPEGMEAPSLYVDGDSGGFVDPDLLGRVLTSIRYKSFDDFPQLPDHVLAPENDWERTPARSDYPTFSVMLPPGWELEELRGADSLVGELRGDEMRLQYDFGRYGGPPYSPDWADQEGGHAPHQIWEGTIGDIDFSFAKSLSPSSDLRGITGVYAILQGQGGKLDKSVTIYGYQVGEADEWKLLTETQQEIALAIFRTIEFE